MQRMREDALLSFGLTSLGMLRLYKHFWKEEGT